jgi:hypothetical protein
MVRIYVKCILTGIVAALLCLLILVVAVAWYAARQAPRGAAVSVDVSSITRWYVFRLTAAVAFISGFWWRHWRLAR